MLIRKNLLGVTSLLLIVLLGFMPVAAITPKQSQTGKKKTESNTAFTSKKVELVKSDKNLQIITPDGNVVSLPKVNQVLVDQAPLFSHPQNLFADADISKSVESVQKKLIERKEMQELSEVLGIAIADASHLDFYREVADWLGTRYRRGGMSRTAVDCSGFTNIIYKNVFGIQLDRVSTVIAKNVKESVTDKEDLQPGDMVFFSTFGKKYINHVGMYIGEGKFIHASIKKGVIISRLDEGYYSKVFRKGGRA